MHKYFYIYKITCTEGSFKNKFYIGQHSTSNLDDGYKGSGKKLLDYYKKYPKEYTKEILCYCSNKSELDIKEKYYIEHLYNENCLNIAKGGSGGDILANMNEAERIEFGKKVSIGLNSRSEKKKQQASKHLSNGQKNRWKNMSEEEYNEYCNKMKMLYINDPYLKEKTSHYGEQNGMYGKRGINNPNYGSHRSDETKKKQSESAMGKNTWTKDRPWVNKNGERKRIKINELETYLNDGWNRGKGSTRKQNK